MDYKEFNEKILTMFSELKNNQSILVEVCQDSSFVPMDESRKEKIIEVNEIMHDLTIPEDIVNLSFNNNLKVFWGYKLESEKLEGGEFNFVASAGVYDDVTKSDFADELSDFEKDLYKQGYRYFDSRPDFGDGINYAMKIEGDSVVPTVWFVDSIRDELLPLEVDYPEYIKHSIKLKGLYQWQYLYLAGGFANFDNVDYSPLRKRLEDYSKLFPNIDVSEYLARYDKLDKIIKDAEKEA